MRINRKGAGAAAAGVAIAMIASACAAGTAAADYDAPPAADGVPADYEQATIGAAQRVGAMESFEVGDTFRATEPISVDMLYRVHAQYPVEDDWRLWTALQEFQNVTVERVDVPLADFEARRNMLISAGDFPSIVTHVHNNHETPWVAGGALLPISDYFQYMPHFSHFATEWDLWDQLDAIRQDDGRIYRLPGLLEVPDAGWGMIVNQDLFDEAGITEDPRTLEEFVDAFEQIVRNTGAEYGYAALHSDLNASLTGIAANFHASAGWGLQPTWWDDASGEFVANALTDGYRALVEFYHELYSRGILDPEIADYDLTAEKFVNGRVAAITSNTGGLQARIGEAHEAGLPGNFRLMVQPDGFVGGYMSGGRLAWGIALNDDLRHSPYFLATLQLIDWLWFSAEGREFSLFGIEGETFTRAEDGTRTLRDDLFWRVHNAGAPTPLQDYGFGDATFALGYGGSVDLIEDMLTPSLRDYRTELFERRGPLPVAPAVPLTDLELERISMTQSQVNDHVRSNTLQFILGLRPLSEWDDFTREVEGLGVQTIVDLHNEAKNR